MCFAALWGAVGEAGEAATVCLHVAVFVLLAAAAPARVVAAQPPVGCGAGRGLRGWRFHPGPHSLHGPPGRLSHDAHVEDVAGDLALDGGQQVLVHGVGLPLVGHQGVLLGESPQPDPLPQGVQVRQVAHPEGVHRAEHHHAVALEGHGLHERLLDLRTLLPA